MARRKSNTPRMKKTMHVLPETAQFIETEASSRNIYEASVIDEAIALLRKTKDANLSSVA
ncbi:hypothetical protein [Pseudanabaena galeata]|jgi:hypothetical protein|uniref:hypothetical protein n=1 Tax=Pseudanabaena galeata TaxID=1112103 RepID=UPI002478ECBB|nr:hypothetical protein [Pseudanabaena galeata]WGS74093.1 hypothetical protein OA858_08710 [Pseudanabaena galeata CCNP1313]